MELLKAPFSAFLDELIEKNYRGNRKRQDMRQVETETNGIEQDQKGKTRLVRTIDVKKRSRKKIKQESVRSRWPYDMRPSVRADKYIRDASG